MTSAFGSEVQQALLRDGYFIAPGLFSVQALQEARRACKAHFRSSRVMHSHLGQHDVNAVMKLEQLWPLYSDARLLELVRVALAVERPLFTGPAAGGLEDIYEVDRTFTPEDFLRGAKAAYQMIMNSKSWLLSRKPWCSKLLAHFNSFSRRVNTMMLITSFSLVALLRLRGWLI